MEGKAADAGDIKPFFHLLVFDEHHSAFGIVTGSLPSAMPNGRRERRKTAEN